MLLLKDKLTYFNTLSLQIWKGHVTSQDLTERGKRFESREPSTRVFSLENWLNASRRHNTSLSPSGPSWPLSLAWRRPKWKSGFRTEDPSLRRTWGQTKTTTQAMVRSKLKADQVPPVTRRALGQARNLMRRETMIQIHLTLRFWGAASQWFHRRVWASGVFRAELSPLSLRSVVKECECNVRNDLESTIPCCIKQYVQNFTQGQS